LVVIVLPVMMVLLARMVLLLMMVELIKMNLLVMVYGLVVSVNCDGPAYHGRPMLGVSYNMII
jgi:hypothetical protein